MTKPKQTIESILSSHPMWSKEMSILRKIIKSTELEETIKWGIPTYTINNKNVVGLTGFKNHFGLWFFNGSFLSDPHKLLVNAQEGKTKGMRHMRFSAQTEIDEKIVKAYLLESIENQKQGKEIKPEKKKVPVPEILKLALKKDEKLNAAFKKLTPGKQKEYNEHISSAKKQETKQNRLNKAIGLIKAGKGLNDKYKK